MKFAKEIVEEIRRENRECKKGYVTGEAFEEWLCNRWSNKKRKMYCPECGGTGRDYETIGGKCRECNGAGEVILEGKDESDYI